MYKIIHLCILLHYYLLKIHITLVAALKELIVAARKLMSINRDLHVGQGIVMCNLSLSMDSHVQIFCTVLVY